jgi:hypothetical protein
VSKQSRTVFKAALVIIFAALPFATDWNKSPLGFVACCNVVTLIEGESGGGGKTKERRRRSSVRTCYLIYI